MRILFYILIFLQFNQIYGQSIVTNREYSPVELVRDIFLGTSCIEVDEQSIEINGFNNATYSSYGYFEKGNSNFPLENGILLSTGFINNAVGPNNSLQNNSSNNWYGDRDLEEALEISNTLDATTLEFDFISNQDNQINFEYIFASEQYLRTSSEGRCGYTDGFAFLIKEADSRDDYLNIALVPNTNTPVSVLTIFGNGGLCPPINPQYFNQFNTGNSATNFNGETVVLNAVANVIPGRRYHIKLVIADQGNGLYDSGVFLKAGSFSGNKNLGEDRLITNGNALCFGETTLIDATTANATAYQWYKNGVTIAGATNATYTVNTAGTYKAEIQLNTGCSITGELIVEFNTEAILDQNTFNVCNTNIDNLTEVRLADYNAQIIQNYNPSITISYFSLSSNAENNQNEIYEISFNSNERRKIVYARIVVDSCAPIIQTITFNHNNLSTANTIPAIELCDNLLDNQEAIDLEDYLNLLVTNPNDDYAFFSNETDARLNQNSISSQQIITGNTTYFVRFSQADLCANIAPITFLLKQAGRSDTLIDQTICERAFTTLDAGTGFDSYLWLHNNSTSQILNNVPVGNYQVRLESNGCFFMQEVTVHAAENPIIETIVITGNTVTVLVSNATSDYLYALDNGPFQRSNIFYNVGLGQHTIQVKSSAQCNSVDQNFSIVKMSNFISPNQDGKNDVLNYSDLNLKINPKFQVYTRYGQLIFDGNSSNNFIWNGTLNGKKIVSGSYWYILEWTEPGSEKIIKQTNWILVKSK